jgi:O-antigen/teichoic acid export membrane protein
MLAAGTAAREIAMVVPRARQDIRFFSANSFLFHYGGLLAGVAFVLQGHGPWGYTLGLALGALGAAVLAAAYSLRRSEGRAGWDAAFSRQVARTASPVVPLALAQMSLLSLDYVFVSRFLGTAALATYGLAYTFASPVMLAVAVLNVTLLPEYVRRHRGGDAALLSFVERTLAWGWAAALSAVAAAVVVGPAIVEVVAGPAYRAAGDLLPAIVASYALFALGQVLHVVRSALVADVRASAVVAVLCAGLNAAGGLLVIPVHGLPGAAAVTLASFVLYFLGMVATVRPLLPAARGWMSPPPFVLALAAAPAILLAASSPWPRVAPVLGLGAASVWALLRALSAPRARGAAARRPCRPSGPTPSRRAPG